MRTAQDEYGWKLNFGQIAQIFRGGCIIRAAFLQKITEAYARNPEASEPPPRYGYFNKTIQKAQTNWRKVVSPRGRRAASPVPTFASALSLLRRLPRRPFAGQPAPGPARLLRRPHLRAH